MKENDTSRPRSTGHTRAGLFRSTRVLCAAAMLCVLSFLLGLLAKRIFGTSPLRITFENLPIVFAGITLGPCIGGAVGVAADLLSCVSAGQMPSAIIAIGSLTVGVLSGLCGRLCHRRLAFLSVLTADAAAQVAGSAIVKSIGLSFYFGIPIYTLAWRIPLYLGIALLESYLIYFLLKNQALRREWEKLTK